MRTRAINLALLLALLVFVGLNWTLRVNTARPNFEFLPEMAHSPAYGAFSPNPEFADRKTLQLPVSGTIARDQTPLHYRATPADALRAGEKLRNPFSAGDASALERGQAVFAGFCQACHGTGATGNGPVIARGYPAPPSLLADKTVNMKDGQLFHVLTYGQANMPSYASQVSAADRWKVILYVRQLQGQSRERPGSAGGPARLTGSAVDLPLRAGPPALPGRQP